MSAAVDIHLHTSYSSCSNFHLDLLARRVAELKLPVVTVTDHGSSRACGELARMLSGVIVVWGIEVTAKEGDFLIFSPDRDYVNGLGIYLKTVTDIRRDEATAVVWAHPRVPQTIGWRSPSPESPQIETVLRNIDALEIFNGTMLELAAKGVLRPAYFNNLNYIAHTHGIALTGGSDAHDFEHYRVCWTEFDDEIASPADFVRAVKLGRVRPGYDGRRLGIDVTLAPVWEEES